MVRDPLTGLSDGFLEGPSGGELPGLEKKQIKPGDLESGGPGMRRLKRFGEQQASGAWIVTTVVDFR